jgi:hypothetical protein
MSRAEQPTKLSLPQVRSFGQTMRDDAWWITPLLVFLGLSAFIVYSTWAAVQGNHYFLSAQGQHYLSPMYSPVLFDSWKLGQGEAYTPSGHAWFGEWPSWLPQYLLFLPLTPAFLVLWAPAGFRFTCYYYRGAYYKAFWQDPTSCGVGEPAFRKEKYRGEEKLPLILQNVHRYFFYIAALFIVMLSYDGVMSYIFKDPDTGHNKFGIGVGSLVLTINPILLGGYTFGCHVYRHLVGGRKDHLSELGPRKKVYDCVSCLNRSHMLWAWMSLIWVGFTDAYVRLCSMGVWHDYRIL